MFCEHFYGILLRNLKLHDQMFDVDYKMDADLKSENRNYIDLYIQKL